jgi:hypothetical protein
MIKVRIIKFGNQYAVVERDGVQYRVPIESVIFLENPQYGAIDRKELTAARIVQG